MKSRTYLIILVAICQSLHFCSASFTKMPSSDADLRVVLKHSFELECIYNGADGQGEFGDWYNGTGLVSEKRIGHYHIEKTATSSKLTIQIFVASDAEVTRWYVTSSKSSQPDSIACEFKPIRLIPSPQGLETNRANERVESRHESIRRTEDESLLLKCLIKPPVQTGDSSSAIEWEYSPDGKSFDKIHMDGVEVTGDTLSIEQVKKVHRGYYQCTLNNIPFTVLLRVKDRYAALWPFLGILGILAVLAIVILIFEKRQKTTRRAMANDDDENDHANNPLVQTTNRASDNDNKKRAVRA